MVHEHDFRDWGAGVQVSWDPGLKGRGLQLSLSSAQGQHAGGRTTLWHDANVLTHPRDIGAGGLDTPTRTDSEVAYGLTAFGGLLTPYSQLQLAGYGRALSVGTTWHARPAGCHCGSAWKRRAAGTHDRRVTRDGRVGTHDGALLTGMTLKARFATVSPRPFGTGSSEKPSGHAFAPTV